MSTWSGKILADDRLLFEKSPGEVLAEMAKARWPRETVKRIAAAWKLSEPTAVHVVKGEGSGTVLGKAIRAEGWTFLDEFGERLTGISYLEWKEELTNRLIAEAERDKETISRLHLRREALARQSTEQHSADDGQAAYGPRRRNG